MLYCETKFYIHQQESREQLPVIGSLPDLAVSSNKIDMQSDHGEICL